MEVMVYALFNKKIIYSPGKIKFEEEFECNHMESKGIKCYFIKHN